MADRPEFGSLFDRFERGEVREAERVVELDNDDDDTLDSSSQELTIDTLVAVNEVVSVELGIAREDEDGDLYDPTFFNAFQLNDTDNDEVVFASGDVVDGDGESEDDNVVEVTFYELNADEIVEADDSTNTTVHSDSQELNDESYDDDADGSDGEPAIDGDNITHVKVTARGY